MTPVQLEKPTLLARADAAVDIPKHGSCKGPHWSKESQLVLFLFLFSPD